MQLVPSFALGGICVVLVGLVVCGILPLRCLLNPGDVLYWISWLNSGSWKWLVAQLRSWAVLELGSVAEQSLQRLEALLPTDGILEKRLDQEQLVEAFDTCRRGIDLLDGPLQDGLLPAKFKELKERLHLQASRVYLVSGDSVRAGEQYLYADESRNTDEASSEAVVLLRAHAAAGLVVLGDVSSQQLGWLLKASLTELRELTATSSTAKALLDDAARKLGGQITDDAHLNAAISRSGCGCCNPSASGAPLFKGRGKHKFTK
eukprot:TRINITY_DN26387_c0_g1_i1.p1 TRINITY_DN26387_c0_g1~~TRINITY_DN26387_c0_g1_i1.p1  ORF type:complete len:262 (-),score=36.70 TRINITY_DN26387_c0_g1_i1:426-1211(-)